jgi:hypothetical protein
MTPSSACDAFRTNPKINGQAARTGRLPVRGEECVGIVVSCNLISWYLPSSMPPASEPVASSSRSSQLV